MSDEHSTSSDGSDEADCRRAALKYLSRREYCAIELHRKLRTKGFAGGLCDAVIEELETSKLLSDERYAEAYLRGKLRKGFGPARIRHALDENGVARETVEAVFEAAGVDWLEQLKQQVRKKYGDRQPDSYKDWVKRARYLNDRGYSADMIKQVVEFNQ